MTPEIRAQVREGRLRQGLPPTIEDEAFLLRLAAILLEVDPVDLLAEPEPEGATA